MAACWRGRSPWVRLAVLAAAVGPVAQGRTDDWLRCLGDIREALFRALGEHLQAATGGDTTGPVAYIDPAAHTNVGDNMLVAGTLAALAHLGWELPNVVVCGGVQTTDLPTGPRCFNRFHKLYRGALPSNVRVAVYHPGGNWGNIYSRVQLDRVTRIRSLLRANITVVSFPQSLHYDGGAGAEPTAEGDARALSSAVLRAKQRYGPGRLVLMWRQRDSLEAARRLFPFATNVAVPDVAFALGPFLADQRHWSPAAGAGRPGLGPRAGALGGGELLEAEADGYRGGQGPVDLLLVLRSDNESTLTAFQEAEAPDETRRAHVASVLARIARDRAGRAPTGAGPRGLYTFRIADWREALNHVPAISAARFRASAGVARQCAPTCSESVLSAYMATQIRDARRALGLARVVVTDRLHASVLALLAYQRHVVIDNTYGKLAGVRGLAFDASPACRPPAALRYRTGTGLEDALGKAVELLEEGGGG